MLVETTVSDNDLKSQCVTSNSKKDFSPGNDDRWLGNHLGS